VAALTAAVRCLRSYSASQKPQGPVLDIRAPLECVLMGVNADGWRAVEMLAVESDGTLNALAVEAFNDLPKKHGKRQNVENPLLD
jgi:hypothetical protein